MGDWNKYHRCQTVGTQTVSIHLDRSRFIIRTIQSLQYETRYSALTPSFNCTRSEFMLLLLMALFDSMLFLVNTKFSKRAQISYEMRWLHSQKDLALLVRIFLTLSGLIFVWNDSRDFCSRWHNLWTTELILMFFVSKRIISAIYIRVH